MLSPTRSKTSADYLRSHKIIGIQNPMGRQRSGRQALPLPKYSTVDHVSSMAKTEAGAAQQQSVGVSSSTTDACTSRSNSAASRCYRLTLRRCSTAAMLKHLPDTCAKKGFLNTTRLIHLVGFEGFRRGIPHSSPALHRWPEGRAMTPTAAGGPQTAAS